MLRQKFLEECTPGYYNNEGKPAERGRAQRQLRRRARSAFIKVLEDWRAAGRLEGLELARE